MGTTRVRRGHHITADTALPPPQRYTLRVSSSGATWDVNKRYHDIDVMHGALVKQFASLAPALPPKTWFGATSPAFVESRRQALQRYFNGICESSAMARSMLVLDFLSA